MTELSPSASLRQEFAPSGRLKVGLNTSNFLLVSSRDCGGEPKGIAPDIGRDLARRLTLPLCFKRYDSAGALADALGDGRCDVGFLAVELQRAEKIAFANAYLEIDTTYLVASNTPIKDIADVDRPGVRIAVVDRSAYDLWLTRNIKHATLVRADDLQTSLRLFHEQGLEAVASLRTVLLPEVKAHPGTRLLEGSFSSVMQSIGTPKTRTSVLAFLDSYLRDIKAANLIGQLIQRHQLEGVSVAA